ncbi:MAG TPA: ComEC/Rec2 family competence protein [Rhizomicrobium sp.]|nr:ComEC/Rec2 family competence protein [Rhizomicrobium sp.]
MVVGPLTTFRSRVWEAPDVRAWPATVLRAWRDHAAAERERWPLWLPVGLGTGIGIYFALPVEPSAEIGIGVGVAAVAGAILAGRTARTTIRILLVALVIISMGFSYAKWREVSVAAPVLQRNLGPIPLDGRVESVQVHGKGLRIVMGALQSKRFKPGTTPWRVRISIRAKAGDVVPDNWIHTTAMLMPPPGPAAPGGYDFGRAAFFDRIGGVGYSYGHVKAIPPSRSETTVERVSGAIARLRWRMTARIQAALPGSTGGIASALITGDRGSISDEDEAALRDAGLAHVLAIAGLHMALVGLGLFWVVRAVLAAIPPVALNYPIKKWAAIAALGGATFYLIVSGAATPATRAYIMLATMLIAILMDRPALSMRSVALAAFVILLLRPESLLEPGFQMSFAAVAGLVAVAEWEAAHRLHDGPRAFENIRRYMRGIAITSFVGSVTTAPYAIFHFDRATHYAVLGNLLAMPVMGFVTMPAAAISVIAMPFHLEAWPLKVMGWGIEVMLSVGRFVSGLPGAISTVSAWPVSALIVLSLGGLWTVLWRRSWRWFGLIAMAGGFVLALTTRGPDILVARDGATVAVRGPDGVLRLMRKASDDYSADEWLKRDGDGRDSDAAIATRKDGVSCDGYGCIAKGRRGMVVAAVQRVDALDEDCANATIVLSAVPASRSCTQPKLVIDKFNVARAGGYAIWFGKEMRVETVEGARGQRPWSRQPRAPRKYSQYRRIKPTSLP